MHVTTDSSSPFSEEDDDDDDHDPEQEDDAGAAGEDPTASTFGVGSEGAATQSNDRACFRAAGTKTKRSGRFSAPLVFAGLGWLAPLNKPSTILMPHLHIYRPTTLLCVAHSHAK